MIESLAEPGKDSRILFNRVAGEKSLPGNLEVIDTAKIPAFNRDRAVLT
jgi:hypothetical protein